MASGEITLDAIYFCTYLVRIVFFLGRTIPINIFGTLFGRIYLINVGNFIRE